jgi:hypothetical protein
MRTMKAIFFLATVLVTLSTPAISQSSADRSPNFSESGIRAGQDNMSFAQAVRRKTKVRRPACSSGTCQWWQTCCPTYNSYGEENGHACINNGPFPVFCERPW